MGTACLDTENTPDPSTASTRKSKHAGFCSGQRVFQQICHRKIMPVKVKHVFKLVGG